MFAQRAKNVKLAKTQKLSRLGKQLSEISECVRGGGGKACAK